MKRHIDISVGAYFLAHPVQVHNYSRFLKITKVGVFSTELFKCVMSAKCHTRLSVTVIYQHSGRLHYQPTLMIVNSVKRTRAFR